MYLKHRECAALGKKGKEMQKLCERKKEESMPKTERMCRFRQKRERNAGLIP